MGIKSTITLTEAQKLFESFHLTQLLPTKDGVIDTTYRAKSTAKEYILKKYERDIQERIAFDTKLLEHLSRKGLAVPKLLHKNKEWYLYTHLTGKSPQKAQLHHLKSVGRFVAQLHRETQYLCSKREFLKNYDIKKLLREQKIKNYFYYKKIQNLQTSAKHIDGFIHGDIFMDNTLFCSNKMALFDFIDGGDGNFAFELGVILLSFNPSKRKSYTEILLRSYNQNAPRKIALRELEEQRQEAAKLYILLRLTNRQNTKRAKELVKLC